MCAYFKLFYSEIYNKHIPFSNCSTSSAKESLIYSYGKSFNGFAAKLTGDKVAKFSGENARNKMLTVYIRYGL